jgi:ketosteroid isomerase-like protein
VPIDTLHAWHAIVAARDAAGLDALLADDVVFHSPVVHTPQRGKALTTMYLAAAIHVFTAGPFRYVREVAGHRDAVLEFEAELDGILVNGVDMFRWSDDGRIVDFKVMIRPLKAIEVVHRKMAEMLAAGRKA